LSTIAASVLLGTVAAPASAQAIQVSLQSFAGRTSADLADLATTTAVPVSQAECDAAALLDFRFSGVDNTRAQLHFFHGSNCEMSSVRNDTTDTSCVDLTLEYSINMNTEVNQEIPISSLIDCTGGSSGTRTIFVLALDNETSEVSGAGQAVSFPIAFDFAGPSAPTDLVARNGRSETTLEWTASTDQIDRYDVFFIANGCDASGALTTDRLSDPDNLLASDILTTASGSSSSATVEFPADTAVGTHHAIAIRAVDNAGNAGGLSNVECVSTIAVTTWFDEYCSGDSPPAACSSSGCSAVPSRRGSFGGPLLAILALGGLVWRARR